MAVLLVAAGTGFCGAMADAESPLEYQVKAAFLLNFTRFVDWPPEAFPNSEAPFTICIYGGDPFGGALERTVEGETVNGRPVAIRRIGLSQPHACQVVFADRQQKDVSRLLAGLGAGVLTVGETDQFLREGGMIAFHLENRRVRFDINQSAATRAGLRLSSKLLSVARNVEK